MGVVPRRPEPRNSNILRVPWWGGAHDESLITRHHGAACWAMCPPCLLGHMPHSLQACCCWQCTAVIAADARTHHQYHHDWYPGFGGGCRKEAAAHAGANERPCTRGDGWCGRPLLLCLAPNCGLGACWGGMLGQQSDRHAVHRPRGAICSGLGSPPGPTAVGLRWALLLGVCGCIWMPGRKLPCGGQRPLAMMVHCLVAALPRQSPHMRAFGMNQGTARQPFRSGLALSFRVCDRSAADHRGAQGLAWG